ncbi:MAG: 2Fe-2S iron-sulfur cluster-binding protein [Bythopirellula sp.]
MDWQSVGFVAGATLLGLAGLQALGAAYVGRRRMRSARASCAERQQAFNRQLKTKLQWALAAKPIFKAWSGTRRFKVAAVVDEALDCKSFYLVPSDGHPLPRFEPGQFLTFNLPTNPRQKPLVRCYSLSDRPREDYYRVTIKRARPPAGNLHLPPGIGSNFFHERVQAETTLEVQAPQGAFFLDPTDDAPVVLIGAGVGITPLVSMASTIAHDGRGRTAYFFGGFGNSREHPFRQYMAELDAEIDHLHFDISYSRPMPSDQVGREYQNRGYVDVGRLKQVLPSNNFRFYICGPTGMMQTLVPALRTWGVPESHIHYEAFGPATVKGMKQTRTSADIEAGPCQVEFLLANACLAWDDGHESLLEFAESQGVALDYGCRAGNCGQCLVSVKAGSVEHVKEPGLHLDKNQCLTCIGIPRGNVVLEA